MSNKHCCNIMTEKVEHTCYIHVFPFDCPDYTIHYTEKFDEYGIVVHDGSMSVIRILYCPWCGKKLPDSKR